MKRDRHEGNVYDAMLQERIGQALRGQGKEPPLEPQVLESWVKARRDRRRSLRKRYAIAACTALVFLCAAALALHFGLLSGSDVSMAGKGGDQINETEGGAVIKGNQADADENLGSVKIVIDDWKQVEEAQIKYPDMLIPEYIPEGYEFEKLVIEENSLKREYYFFYWCENGELTIKQSSEIESVAVYNYNEILQVGEREVFVNYKENVAHFEEEDIFVTIKGQVDRKEILKIVKNIERVN